MRLLSLMALVLAVFMPASTLAATSLRIQPLKYQEAVELGEKKQGFVDVSNPSDSPVDIIAEVEGFRQVGRDGTIEFFQDPALAAAIDIDVTQFELGAREAARIAFTIDPNKLKPGGAYGAIFFKTIPKETSNAQDAIKQSARVGTLLILDIGGKGTKSGEISSIKAPFFAFGRTLPVAVTYTNTGTGAEALAFNPELQLRAGFFEKAAPMPSGLVMAGNSRKFEATSTGSHFGLMPVSVQDQVTGKKKTTWVLAVVGQKAFAYLLIFLLLVLAAGFLIYRKYLKN